jgi:radical SAM-linked protein
VFRRFRFTFSKTGDARFLSHRQLMDALERSLRAADVPVRYTEGFNPHIRISMGPPLSLGHEGLAEVFDVDCTSQIRQRHLDGMNRLLPVGVEILDARDLVPGAPSLGKMIAAARYRIAAADDQGWPEKAAPGAETLAGGITEWTVAPDGRLCVELNQRQEAGPIVTVKKLLQAIGVEEERIPLIPVTRERFVLRPVARTGSKGAEGAPKEASH